MHQHWSRLVKLVDYLPAFKWSLKNLVISTTPCILVCLLFVVAVSLLFIQCSVLVIISLVVSSVVFGWFNRLLSFFCGCTWFWWFVVPGQERPLYSTTTKATTTKATASWVLVKVQQQVYYGKYYTWVWSGAHNPSSWCGWEANIARGKAKCCICLKTTSTCNIFPQCMSRSSTLTN